jgi:hypothetical protein
MDGRVIEGGGTNWTNLAQDRDDWRALVNMIMNIWVSYNINKFLNSCTTGSFLRRAQFHEVS